MYKYEIDEEKESNEFLDIVPLKIIKKITDEFFIKDSSIHGVYHWSRVFYYGNLLSNLNDLDKENIAFFSVFHDSKRFNDGYDPEHGIRGAEFFKTFDKIINIKKEQKEVIYEACKIHNYEKQSDNLAVGICLDADRHDLWRVGIIPQNEYLHSIQSKNEEFKKLSQNFTLTKNSTKLSDNILAGIYELNLNKKYDNNILQKIKKGLIK